jgi:hypothetical protein
MRNFKYVDGDESSRLFEKTLIGKITKNRYKVLSSYVRRKSYRQHCGCEWDCCGCVFAVSYSLQMTNNQVTIQMVESRNY